MSSTPAPTDLQLTTITSTSLHKAGLYKTKGSKLLKQVLADLADAIERNDGLAGTPFFGHPVS